VPRNGFRVSSAALIGGGKGGSAVWSIADGRAHRVSVTAFSDDGEIALLTSDVLHVGDHVVIDGAASLEEGQRVIERGEATH
jgi:multidrug efflux pump subunit AcrA (membrane-fusion protein)